MMEPTLYLNSTESICVMAAGFNILTLLLILRATPVLPIPEYCPPSEVESSPMPYMEVGNVVVSCATSRDMLHGRFTITNAARILCFILLSIFLSAKPVWCTRIPDWNYFRKSPAGKYG